MTEKTVIDPDLLRVELDQIRKQGYSISNEDFEAGAIGVGAPVFGRDGKVIAAISAGGPIIRVSQDSLAHFGQLTVDAANKLSRILGYFPSGKQPLH
jgi:DNA-binding IclR family transcriptional regulator